MTRKNHQGMDPMQPTLEQTFTVCGEALLLQTNDARVLEAAQDTLGCVPPDGASTGDPLTIQLFIVEASSNASSTKIDEATLPAFRMQQHLMTITLDRSNTGVVDLLHGFASGVLTSSTIGQNPGLMGVFLKTMALGLLPLGRDMPPIHAACTVRDGKGVLLCSPSGIGKSTLALACLQQGFQLLADDAVFLRLDGGRLMLAGLPCDVRIYPESLPYLEPIEGDPTLKFANHKWKLQVDPEHLNRDAKTALAEPGAIFFLQREADVQAARATPITANETEETLEISWPYHLPWSGQAQAAIDALLQVPAYRLQLGTDLKATVAEIDRVVWRAGSSRG